MASCDVYPPCFRRPTSPTVTGQPPFPGPTTSNQAALFHPTQRGEDLSLSPRMHDLVRRRPLSIPHQSTPRPYILAAQCRVIQLTLLRCVWHGHDKKGDAAVHGSSAVSTTCHGKTRCPFFGFFKSLFALELLSRSLQERQTTDRLRCITSP